VSYATGRHRVVVGVNFIHDLTVTSRTHELSDLCFSDKRVINIDDNAAGTNSYVELEISAVGK
jgi:hypothetical protein